MCRIISGDLAMKGFGVILCLLWSLNAFAGPKRPPAIFTFSPATIHRYVHFLNVPAPPVIEDMDPIDETSYYYDKYHARFIEWVIANEASLIKQVMKLQNSTERFTIELTCKYSPVDWHRQWELKSPSEQRTAAFFVKVLARVFRLDESRFVNGEMRASEENVTISTCRVYIRNYGSPHENSLSGNATR